MHADVEVKVPLIGGTSEEIVAGQVRRLLEAKARLGLHAQRTVELPRVPERLATGAHLALAADIAEKGMVLTGGGALLRLLLERCLCLGRLRLGLGLGRLSRRSCSTPSSDDGQLRADFDRLIPP